VGLNVFVKLFNPVALDLQVNDEEVVMGSCGDPGVVTVWAEARCLLVDWVLPSASRVFVVWLAVEYSIVVTWFLCCWLWCWFWCWSALRRQLIEALLEFHLVYADLDYDAIEI
jgi:hypothetical protein